MWWATLGCGPDPAGCALDAPQLVVASTNFESGALAVIDPASGRRCDPAASAGPDPAVRAFPGRVVVFDRTGGTSIRDYAPGVYEAPRIELAAEPGANVHDVLPVGDELWVAAYERDGIARYGWDGERRGEISLAPWADADGLPEADRLVATPSGAYVGLQRLTRPAWTSDGGAVASLSADGVLEVWDVGPNPKLYADPSDPERLVALTGVFGALDGALERLDPRTGALEVALTEAELGVDFDGFAGVGARWVVLGVDAEGVSTHVCLDVERGEWVRGEADPGWFVEATAGGGEVFVAVRTGWAEGAADAVLAIDPVSCERRIVADDLWLDPFGLAWVDR
ncbi:MAG: hypothetical protein ABMA64_35350 [Myxococcota bacterium]